MENFRWKSFVLNFVPERCNGNFAARCIYFVMIAKLNWIVIKGQSQSKFSWSCKINFLFHQVRVISKIGRRKGDELWIAINQSNKMKRNGKISMICTSLWDEKKSFCFSSYKTISTTEKQLLCPGTVVFQTFYLWMRTHDKVS